MNRLDLGLRIRPKTDATSTKTLERLAISALRCTAAADRSRIRLRTHPRRRAASASSPTLRAVQRSPRREDGDGGDEQRQGDSAADRHSHSGWSGSTYGIVADARLHDLVTPVSRAGSSSTRSYCFGSRLTRPRTRGRIGLRVCWPALEARSGLALLHKPHPLSFPGLLRQISTAARRILCKGLMRL
jgi:hypothetical protein